MKKRTFLGILVSLTGFWLLFPVSKVTSLFNRLKTRPLSDHELQTAALIAEYIYPEDSDPGASALGIDTYCANQSSTSYFRRHIPSLRRVTACLDAESRKTDHSDFSAMHPEDRAAFLDLIASGKADHLYLGIRNDFYTLVDMTIEGCFSDPLHGGNRNARAWQILDGTFKKEWMYV